MSVKDFLKGNESVKSNKGLPEGDTIIDLDNDDLNEEQGKYGLTYKLTQADGSEFLVPVTVAVALKDIVEKDVAKQARVTRQGTTKENTRYTTVPIEEK